MSFGRANYVSENGTTYSIRMSQLHFGASGLATASVNNPYPRHWTPRKVHGISPDRLHHASVVTPDNTALWTGSQTTFSIGGQAYDVTGRSGEKRPNLAPKF